jgi:hypothetical protein
MPSCINRVATPAGLAVLRNDSWKNVPKAPQNIIFDIFSGVVGYATGYGAVQSSSGQRGEVVDKIVRIVSLAVKIDLTLSMTQAAVKESD